MQKQNNSIRNVKLRKKGIRFATEEMNKLSRMWIKRKRKRKTGREGEREGGREGKKAFQLLGYGIPKVNYSNELCPN